MECDSPTDPRHRMGATDPTPSLIRFLEQRLQADLHEALTTGDDPRARYLRQSIGMLDGIRADLAADPRRTPPETVRLLGRWALTYDVDPAFNPSWLLLT